MFNLEICAHQGNIHCNQKQKKCTANANKNKAD